MHPNISINTLCFAPCELDEQIERVARIGVRAITPDLEQVTRLGEKRAMALLRDSGLEVAALTHRAFGFATPELVIAGHERLLRTIEVGAQISAPTIVMTTGGRGSLCWIDALARFAEAVAPCAHAAKEAGIRLAIEPTSHLYADASIAHRLADTVQISRAAGVAVAIDLFACWFDADIENAIAEAAPNTALVQVSDFIPGDRALPCRAIPGDGEIPLDRLLPAIVRGGYRGWFDLEVIGPRLQADGEETGLRRAVAKVTAILERAA